MPSFGRMPSRNPGEREKYPQGKGLFPVPQRPRHLLEMLSGQPRGQREAAGPRWARALPDRPLPPHPPGSATRRPTAVTAVTSCAAAVATTPTRTAWSSAATASITGAATSRAAAASARWSATSASDGRPDARAGDPRSPDPPPGPGHTPPMMVAWGSQMPAVRGGLCFASTWKAPGTEGLATLEGGPGHQRKPTRLKITWQPEPGSAHSRLPGRSKKPRGMGLAGLLRT